MNGEVHSEGDGSPAERFWEEHYRASTRPSNGRPSGALVRFAGPLPEGTALDLGCSQGDDAVWLARRGWRVTAVDFSDVGLARGRSQPGADRVTWLTADVLRWGSPPESFDLVLVAYLHVPTAEFVALLERAIGWLRPGGRLLSLGHDVENLERGVGGPQEPAILHSVERLAPVADLLAVDRLEQVRRETPEGVALDTLLWGRRPV